VSGESDEADLAALARICDKRGLSLCAIYDDQAWVLSVVSVHPANPPLSTSSMVQEVGRWEDCTLGSAAASALQALLGGP
jgi:hypothetical protein